MPLTLATFNVENLLDPRGEPERSRQGDKLSWIARMIDACGADVIGLQEVGTPELVRAVLARTEGAAAAWAEPVVGTADARGIRCALVAKARVRVAEAQVHTAESLPFPVFRVGDPAPFGARIPLRRGVVRVRVATPDLGEVEVLVVHFKSARAVPLRDAAGTEVAPATQRERSEGQLRAIAWRGAEALFVRGLVDDVLRADARARVALVGDMNDLPDSATLRALRGDAAAAPASALHDCAAGVELERRFSCIHDGRRVQIDHVLASPCLFERLAEARFLNAELRSKDAPCDPGVDSDHAPLVVRFV